MTTTHSTEAFWCHFRHVLTTRDIEPYCALRTQMLALVDI